MATLRVLEIFDSLQGEGYWTGVPMTFVRLAGCNGPTLGLGCVRWCDTQGSWDIAAGEEMDAAAVMERVRLPRLCLTGGEPLLQVDGVAKLALLARERDVRVHLETNGTMDPAYVTVLVPEESDFVFDWAVVSPKPPEYTIARGWEELVDELKLVADESLDAATAERLAAAHPGAMVSIQPEYRGGQESVERAVALVMGHPEWRLSLQMHKVLGMR